MIRVRMRLESVVASPARARRFVAELFDEWGLATADVSVRDTALLLVSELVTNAVIHAGSSIDLVVARDRFEHCNEGADTQESEPEVLRVEVHDNSAALPEPQHPSPQDDSGRGLELVEALAYRWGVAPTPVGKTVWFELCTPAK